MRVGAGALAAAGGGARKRRNTLLKGNGLHDIPDNFDDDPFAEETKQEVVMEVDDEDIFKLDSPKDSRPSQRRGGRPLVQDNERASNRIGFQMDDDIDSFVNEVMGGSKTQDDQIKMEDLIGETPISMEDLMGEDGPETKLSMPIEDVRVDDDDRAVKLRLTNQGVIDIGEYEEVITTAFVEKEIPTITDAPFQDSEGEEPTNKDKFQPFTGRKNPRVAKYTARRETKTNPEPVPQSEQISSPTENTPVQEEKLDSHENWNEEQQDNIANELEAMLGKSESNVEGLSQRRNAGASINQRGSSQQKSKINNRVGKVYKEDDDLFGHLDQTDEDQLMKEISQEESQITQERDTFVENFDDLIKATTVQETEMGSLEDQILKEEIASGPDFLNYYRAGSGTERVGSLSERRYKQQQSRQSTSVEDEQKSAQQKAGQTSTHKKRAGFATESSNNDNNSSDKESSQLAGVQVHMHTSSSDQDDVRPKKPSTIGKRTGIDFSSLKQGAGRMTLRELNLALPEENSSLESEEDEDNYLEWLQDEDKRIRFSQMDTEEPFSLQSSKRYADEIVDKKKSDHLSFFDKKKKDYNPYLDKEPKKSQKKTSKKTKKQMSKQRDLIDVIEEMENEDEDEEVSEVEEDQPSEDEEDQEYYSNLYQDVMKNKRGGQVEEEIQPEEKRSESMHWDYKDLMKTIDWNERRYQDKAKVDIKKSAILNQQGTTQNVRTRIISGFQTHNTITNKLVRERQLTLAKSTCLGLSHELILIGNSEGSVWMFDRDTEQHYATFSEKAKEFIGNSVTAIDVHPLRPEYVILGFERGQLVLLDVVGSPGKSLKIIKDHHKNIPIINVKFCDWAGPQGKYFGIVGKTKQNPRESVRKDDTHQQQEDKHQPSWMIVSIDSDGNVMITSLIKIVIVFKVTKHLAIDPLTSYFHTFSSMASRFQSPVHGQGIYDHIPMVALGCRDSVIIIEAKPTGHSELIQINKPEKYYNRDHQNFDPYRPLNVPALAWGYGMSPLLKDRPHSMLAIAWGPVIQLVVLIDNEENDKPFIMDGFYIVRTFDLEQTLIPSSMGDLIDEESKEVDLPDEFLAFKLYKTSYIEQIFFLSDSTILILLSGQEIRILDTQGFHPEQYDADRIFSEPKKHMRQLNTSQNIGKQYFNEELESGIKCQQVLKSELGSYSDCFPIYSQTLKCFAGKLCLMSSKGLQSCNHLTWQQSIYDFQKIQVRSTTTLVDDDHEEEDLTSVFLRALEIYKGRVKGYQGLIDNAYLRENFLRAELKLLVKEIIQQAVEDTVAHVQPVVSTRQSVQVAEGLNEQEKRFQKIVRIAIEFCVELRDCDFLFKDMCWLFQDYGGRTLELLFVSEIEPYIMAGKFQEWELPPDVFESFVSRYYMHTEGKSISDTPSPDVFEKIIVNLNLSQCPKSSVLQFIKYSEQHFLTTSIIFLYTQLFERKDNASCVQVLFSLYDLYKRATEEQKNSASIIDLQMLRDTVSKVDSEEQQKIVEKSQIYLGYKLFWVIRLFLNGKKFPQGNIKESKWRAYIHDIVQFLSNPEILEDLVKIDAETLFQVVSVLFLRTSRPYDLVLLGRDEILSAGPSNSQLRYQTHIDFLKDMDSCILGTEGQESDLPDADKQKYLFFVANVVAKDRELTGLTPSYFFRITRDILKYHTKYLEFNKNLQDLANKKVTKSNEPLQPKTLDPLQIMQKVNELKDSMFTLSRQSTAIISAQQEEAAKMATEELRYVSKTENDILNLIRKSEPLDNQQIQDLLTNAEVTSFEQVQLYLLEKKEEYVKCLQMLLREADKKRSAVQIVDQTHGHLSHFANSKQIQDTSKLPIATQLLLMSEIGAQAERKGDRTIRWLSEKIGLLEARADLSPEASLACKALKTETMQNVRKLLLMSRVETVRLIEERFEGAHKDVLMSDQLRREPLEQLHYLETLLEEQQDAISEAIRSYGIGGQSASNANVAKGYIEFIKQRLRLCCQFNPQRVFSVVEQMVKGKNSKNGGGAYYPIEDCLAICQEFKQIEAAFLLNKKLGKYYEAVTQGLTIIRTKVDLRKVKIELYFANKNKIDTSFCLTNSQMSESLFFDAIFKRVYRILVKYGKEVESNKEEQVWYLAIDTLLDLKQHEAFALKAYCRRFLQHRLNLLVEAMSRTVPFGRFLEHALGRYHDTQFKEFQELILQIVFNQTSEENVLLKANSAISKVNNVLFESFQQSTKFGILYRQKKCQHCKKYLDKQWYDEEGTMMVEDEIDVEDDDNPLTDELIKVFACCHTFHMGCLRRNYRKKLTQAEHDAIFINGATNLLRCPTCNIADVEAGHNQKQGRPQAVGVSKPGQAPRGGQNKQTEDEIQAYRQKQERNVQLRNTRRETKEMNAVSKKIEKLRRRMDYFESSSLDQGLTLGNFAKVSSQGKSKQSEMLVGPSKVVVNKKRW